MSGQHTLGRLRYERTSGFDYGSYEFWIPGLCTNIKTEDEARRLVACWNATIGIPTDVLEAMPEGPASLMPMYAKIDAHRAELMEALKDARRELAYAGRQDAHDRVHATIRKVERDAL